VREGAAPRRLFDWLLGTEAMARFRLHGFLPVD